MALPNIMRRLFRGDGYGPLLKPEIIPFASDLASSAADVAASTEWVKNLAVTPIYIDSSVASSGDGFSAATAVKTISEAMGIANRITHGYIKFVIAGGTYAIDSAFFDRLYLFELLGNIILNGSVRAVNGAIVSFYSENNVYTTTINATDSGLAAVETLRDSTLLFFGNVTINNNISKVSLQAVQFSRIIFYNSLSITHNSNDGHAIGSLNNSYLHFGGNVTVTGTAGTGTLVYTYNVSNVYFATNLDGTNFTSRAGIYVQTKSVVYCASGSLKINADYSACITVTQQSNFLCAINGTSILKNSGDAPIIGCYSASACRIVVDSGYTLSISSVSVSTKNGIYADTFSYIEFIGNGTITFSGAFGNVTRTTYSSTMFINTGLTLNGTPSSGKRYDIWSGGIVWICGHSAGANRIPGASAGYIDNSSSQKYLNYYG